MEHNAKVGDYVQFFNVDERDGEGFVIEVGGEYHSNSLVAVKPDDMTMDEAFDNKEQLCKRRDAYIGIRDTWWVTPRSDVRIIEQTPLASMERRVISRRKVG